MVKLHFVQLEGGAITYSNYSFKEHDTQSTPFEVNEEDLAAVKDGTKDFKIEGGNLLIVDSTRKADQEAAEQAAKEAAEAEKAAKTAHKLELIQKVTSGTATPEEQQEFANLL